MGQMVFAPRSSSEQVEMLAGMLQVFLSWFQPPRPGPVGAPPGGKRVGQNTESLVEVDIADEFKLDVCHRLITSAVSLLPNRLGQPSCHKSIRFSRDYGVLRGSLLNSPER
jgi:hypothetical protein